MPNNVHIRQMTTRLMKYVIKEITDLELQRRIIEHVIEIQKLLDEANNKKAVKG